MPLQILVMIEPLNPYVKFTLTFEDCKRFEKHVFEAVFKSCDGPRETLQEKGGNAF